MLGVCGQSIEDPGDAAGCGVMALKHEGVHFRMEVLVRQAVPVLPLGDREGGQGLSLPPSSTLVCKASGLPCHTHLGKEEDVQEVQVPLAPDLLELSLLLQLSLPQLDHLVCPEQCSQAELRALGAQTQPPTVAHLPPVPQSGCQVDQECGNGCASQGESSSARRLPVLTPLNSTAQGDSA